MAAWLSVAIAFAMPSVAVAVPTAGFGYELERYAELPFTPTLVREHMGFDSTGNLLLQGGNVAGIYRARPDAPALDIVASLSTAPSPFLLDADGRFTGVEGGLLVIPWVSDRNTDEAALAVLPTGQIVALWQDFEAIGTPSDITYDRDGRVLLLYSSEIQGPDTRLYVSDGGSPQLLLSHDWTADSIAVDPANRIFLSTRSPTSLVPGRPRAKRVQIFEPDGSLVDDNFVEFDSPNLGEDPPWIRFGSGEAFGTTGLYVGARTTPGAAGIVRVDPDGRRTTIVDGFATGGYLIFEFGPDGLLYVFGGGRPAEGLFRVSPCATATCLARQMAASPACVGQSVPSAIVRNLQQAAAAAEQAAEPTGKAQKKTLRRAKQALRAATRKTRRSSRGKRPKVDAPCATAIQDVATVIQDEISAAQGTSVRSSRARRIDRLFSDAVPPEEAVKW